MQHSGSCHCGEVTAVLDTCLNEAAIAPRACSCTFCQKQKPNWFADPSGILTISYLNEPIRYQFGTKTADFLICSSCGVLVAAVCEIEGQLYAVANLNVLVLAHDWAANAIDVDFDGEGTGDRLKRRTKNWMPTSVMRTS